MGILALFLGILGGGCAVVGVLVATQVIEQIASLDWLFWFVLSALLLLGTIASLVGRTPQYE